MISEQINNLNQYFKDKKVVIAFSGGIDSTVLLEFALQSAKEVLAVTVKSSLVPMDEMDFAVRYLQSRDIPYRLLQVNPLDHPNVAKNDIKRCYYCKRLIFESIIDETKEFKPDIIVEGSNISDLSDYRPGMEAVKELSIKSPFLELNISKKEIRGLSKIMSLEISEKPATTCLATRIPYGQEITEERLKKIELAESIIKEILPISVLRVRDHKEIARIEVLEEDMMKIMKSDHRNLIREKLKQLDFSYITLDLGGYKQGSMNINIEGVKDD